MTQLPANPDLINIPGALFILAAGLVAIAFSIPGLRKRDFTLLNLGLFFVLYGLSWLAEIQPSGDTVGSILPLTAPSLHSIFTFLIPVAFSGFLLNVIGRGLYSSMFWFYISTILYAVFGITHDLLYPGNMLNPSINTGVLALWCLGGGINVILLQAKDPGLKAFKITLYLFVLCLAYDNLVVMNVLPWRFRLQHIDIFVLLAGMAYFTVRHYRASATDFINVIP
jgi:hypothetical protein